MAKTFREINNIDSASQKPLWNRSNPGVKNQGKNFSAGDTGKNKDAKNTLPATKSLTRK